MTRRDPSFAALEQAVEASIAGRSLERGRMYFTAAARGSRAVRKLIAVARSAQARPLSRQLEFLGIVAIAFAAANFVMTALMPEASAPAFPAFVWGSAAVIGVSLLALARRVARAANQKNIA